MFIAKVTTIAYAHNLTHTHECVCTCTLMHGSHCHIHTESLHQGPQPIPRLIFQQPLPLPVHTPTRPPSLNRIPHPASAHVVTPSAWSDFFSLLQQSMGPCCSTEHMELPVLVCSSFFSPALQLPGALSVFFTTNCGMNEDL